MTALDNAPDHWTRTTIGEIAEVRLGRQRSPQNHSGDDMRPYLRAANVNWYALRLGDIAEMNFTDDEMKTYALQAGDILVVEGSGSASEVGKCVVVPDGYEGHGFQNTLIRLRPGDGIDSRWLMYRVNAEAELGGFLALARGSGIFHLGSTRTGKWPIAVPPLDEQKRIVEELDRALTRVSHVRAQLEDLRDRAALQRRLVLEHAVRGAGLPTSGGHAARELHRVAAVLDPEPTKTDRQPVPAWLPDGWAWVPVRVAVGDDGLIADGDWVETKDQDPEGDVRLLQLSDVGTGEFRDRSDRHVNSATAERLGVTDVLPGDVLVARLGDPPGDATVVPDLEQRAITAVDVCIVRPVAGATTPAWLEACFNSPSFRSAVIRHQSGTTRKRIARLKLEELRVPVPPLADQAQILVWLRTQMLRLDRLDHQLEVTVQRCDTLRRSILKAAFEGRL